jgi:hypothetical protein
LLDQGGSMHTTLNTGCYRPTGPGGATGSYHVLVEVAGVTKFLSLARCPTSVKDLQDEIHHEMIVRI